MQRPSFFKRSPTSATKIILLLRASNTPWFDTSQQPIYPLSDTISIFGRFEDVKIYAHPYSHSKVNIALSRHQPFFHFLSGVTKYFHAFCSQQTILYFHTFFLFIAWPLHNWFIPNCFECKFTRLLGLSSKLMVVDLQHGNINASIPYYAPSLLESVNTCTQL